MRIVMFYHSLLSDWNHGNAHFLRGIATELLAREHEVTVLEPQEGWSLKNLIEEHGQKPIRKFRAAYPQLRSLDYVPEKLDLDQVLAGADVVLVHEWNDPDLVRRIGQHHRAAGGGYRLFFHDTHHRLVTNSPSAEAYDLSHYDGVLAYGKVLSDLYRKRRGIRRVWTWHEAADTRLFQPIPSRKIEGDLVWIGNWGDGERTAELQEYLVEPVRALGLKARVYGVRYPEEARRQLEEAGIEYEGWLPNFEVPKVFSRFRMTVHIPRRPYVEALPGIPTIRVFEALACGIPLLMSPWKDQEQLFHPGRDFLTARDGAEMKQKMSALLRRPERRRQLTEQGLATIRQRHTCAHRVDELLQIVESLNDQRL